MFAHRRLLHSYVWMAESCSARTLSSAPCLVLQRYLPSWLFLTSFLLVSFGPDGVCPEACVWAKLHSWLSSLTGGMRPVRRHQGDSSQEGVRKHHCPRLFRKDWSSLNITTPVLSSQFANSLSNLGLESVWTHRDIDFQPKIESFFLYFFFVPRQIGS